MPVCYKYHVFIRAPQAAARIPHATNVVLGMPANVKTGLFSCVDDGLPGRTIFLLGVGTGLVGN